MATAKIAVRLKGQIKCFHHKGRQLELYCEQCQELACLKCVSSIHKGHLFCDLSEIARQKKQRIRNFVDKTEQKELVGIRNYIASTYTLLKENDSTFDKLAKQLKEHTERLKQDLDTLTAETLSLYHTIKDDNIKLIQKYKQELDMYDKQLKHQMQECKKTLQQGSHIEIYDDECEIDPQLHLPVKPLLRTVSFTPNKNPRNYLKLALGTFDDSRTTSTFGVKDRSVSLSHGQGESSTQQQSGDRRRKAVSRTKLLTEPTVMEEWMNSYHINSICPTTDDQAWTSDYSNTLTLLDRKGKVIQEITHKANITDISLSPTTQRLWACDEQNNILELVSKQLPKRFGTKDQPRCICVTSDNHIIIGMSKHITKYTPQGQIVLTTKTTGTGEPLVWSPYRITECPITNNIAVIDHTYHDDGGNGDKHVVVMDTNFQELFMYRGVIPSIYKQKLQIGNTPFNPYGIVYDSRGNIITADYDNGEIHILSSDGKELKILDTDTDGIVTVGVSRQGVLWFVSWDDVKLLKYYE